MWDIAPSQDEITQGWGQTTFCGEWVAPWLPDAGCGDGQGRYHAGIDLGFSGGGNVTCGRPVYATRAGEVRAVGANGAGDSGFARYLGPNAVCVLYDGGMFVLHGHLSAATVSVGQRVKPGDQLGAIGDLGSSTACHLHVEARLDGPFQGVTGNAANVRDPRPYLNQEALPVGVNTTDLKTEFVRNACWVALGRAPDQAFLNQYVAAISDDLSNLNAVLGGIYDSQEAQNYRRKLGEAVNSQP